jgi:hypothetical protein
VCHISLVTSCLTYYVRNSTVPYLTPLKWKEFAYLLYCCEFLAHYVIVKKQACIALEHLSRLCENIPFGIVVRAVWVRWIFLTVIPEGSCGRSRPRSLTALPVYPSSWWPQFILSCITIVNKMCERVRQQTFSLAFIRPNGYVFGLLRCHICEVHFTISKSDGGNRELHSNLPFGGALNFMSEHKLSSHT